MSLSAPIHVLGVGSIYGNDTFGWKLIDELAKRDSGYVLHKLINPMVELIPAIRGAGAVIVVDFLSGAEDEIYFDHYSRWQPKGERFSSHGLGIVESLQVAHHLGVLPEDCFVYAAAWDGLNIEEQCESFLNRLDAGVVGSRSVAL
ncbi:MAG: hypothetical protein OEW58_11335 [Gammaproteobacteria bacterium]|nr:hypothetical protein [Gammaproteobacteria bacterium]